MGVRCEGTEFVGRDTTQVIAQLGAREWGPTLTIPGRGSDLVQPWRALYNIHIYITELRQLTHKVRNRRGRGLSAASTLDMLAPGVVSLNNISLLDP